MAISKAQQKATQKYVKKAYDRLEVKVPKGQKAAIQAHAEQTDGSLNAFLNRAVRETMERDGAAAEGQEEGKRNGAGNRFSV